MADDSKPYGLWPSPITPKNMSLGMRLSAPQWDTDGQTLVFGTNTGRTIQRVALSGGTPRHVADVPTTSIGGIDWGDDGNIVFTLNQGYGLYRVPYTGGDPELLLEQTARLRNPKLLPAGNAVIFTDLPSLSTHLLDLETDSVRVLLPGAIDAM